MKQMIALLSGRAPHPHRGGVLCCLGQLILSPCPAVHHHLAERAADVDLEWLAALTDAARRSMGVHTVHDARARLQATLDALAAVQPGPPESLLAMIASAASGLPLPLVWELL